MRPLPEQARQLLDAALVGELTVVRRRAARDLPADPVVRRRPRVHDLEHAVLPQARAHRGEPAGALSITDPVAVGGAAGRLTIQGDARVIAEDPHGGWERLLPIWEAKEPAIVAFLKVRVALPLFFERALIEIVPRRPVPVARR